MAPRDDLFMSYSHRPEDLPFAQDLAHLLTVLGVRVWFDQSRLSAGADLLEEIPAAIRDAEFYALVLTDGASQSAWVEKEASERLKNQDPRVLVLKLSDAPLPPSLAAYGAPRMKYVDFTGAFLDGLVELVDALRPGILLRPAGILLYFDRRREITSQLWDALYRRAARRILLMGHSLAATFADGRDRELVLPAAQRGVTVEALLVNPEGPSQQLAEAQRGMGKEEVLTDKIWRTIQSIQRLEMEFGQPGCESKLQVRVTDTTMYSTLAVFDSVAVWTPYSSRTEVGNNSPATVCYRPKDRSRPSLFGFCKEEFERLWDQAFHPEEVARARSSDMSLWILDHKDRVSQARRWLAGEQDDLPPPLMLIIYPTYKCSFPILRHNGPLCATCAYRQKHGPQDLEPDLLARILDEATAMGVRRFELSGGGEPLQHAHIGELIELLQDRQAGQDGSRFGLLTNGLYLEGQLAEAVAKTFCYVRFSYAEGIQESDALTEEFLRNLREFARHVADSASPRIGLKLLLSKRNIQKAVNQVTDLRTRLSPEFDGIDHLRIKAMRMPLKRDEIDAAEALSFRNEIFDHLFANPEAWPKDTQVDLDLGYVEDDFQCTLSPLFGIVTPSGSLLPCCNYVRWERDLAIADLSDETLESAWGSPRHRAAIGRLATRHVCNSRQGVPCRWVRYQQALDGPMTTTPETPEALRGFL